MADHIHLVGAIPPSRAVADFIGKIKGASSAEFNKLGIKDEKFFWQDEYSVFSCSGRQLEKIVAYVNNQKIHHRDGTIIPLLERTGAHEHLAVGEPIPVYHLDDDLLAEFLTPDEYTLSGPLPGGTAL